MKSNPSKKELRDFGYLVGTFFPIFIGGLIPYLIGHEFRIWTLFIGLPIIVMATIFPKNLIYFYKMWIKIGLILGWLNSYIIIGLLFILVLQPLALIMKIFGYDPLKLKYKYQFSYKENKVGHKTNLKKIF